MSLLETDDSFTLKGACQSLTQRHAHETFESLLEDNLIARKSKEGPLSFVANLVFGQNKKLAFDVVSKAYLSQGPGTEGEAILSRLYAQLAIDWVKEDKSSAIRALQITRDNAKKSEVYIGGNASPNSLPNIADNLLVDMANASSNMSWVSMAQKTPVRFFGVGLIQTPVFPKCTKG